MKLSKYASWTLAIGLALGLATAETAAATTVSSDGTTATVRAGAGPSDVQANWSYNGVPGITWTEALQPLTAGPGCVMGVFGVNCLKPDGRPVESSVTHLGTWNDRFAGTSKGGSTMTVYGNGGHDNIYANGGSSYAYGGGGDDTLKVGSNGNSNAYGGPGNDSLIGVTMMLTLAGEGGDDLVVSASSGYRNQITGDGGHDDLILASDKGDAYGGDGPDTLVVTASRPRDWKLDGGAGNDTLVNGPNLGVLVGGIGNDLIDTSAQRDENGVLVSADTVDCGPGKDTVYAAPDDVLIGCEIRKAGPMPANPAVQAAMAHYTATFPPQ